MEEVFRLHLLYSKADNSGCQLSKRADFQTRGRRRGQDKSKEKERGKKEREKEMKKERREERKEENPNMF